MNKDRLSACLKQQIEEWSAHLLSTSPLLTQAQRGALSQAAMAKYLGSLRYLFSCSEQNLRRAAARAHLLGLLPLAEHLEHKAKQERGHALWAEDDLQTLPDAARVNSQPARDLIRLVELQDRLIAQHPICFLAYALWAEYFTVLVADAWLAALAQSGFQRGQVSAIAKHIDADREHAATGLGVIDGFWTGDPPLGEITTGVAQACANFERFCLEICHDSSHAA
jgi:hypothetical protein